MTRKSSRTTPQALEIVHGTRPDSSRLPRGALRRSGGFVAVAIDDAELIAWGASVDVIWGSTTPLGPMVYCVGRVRSASAHADLVWYGRMAPGDAHFALVGTVRGGNRTGRRFAIWLRDLLNANAAPLPSGETAELIEGLPDWVMVFSDNREISRVVFWFFAACPAVYGARVAARMVLILRHPGQPLARLKAQGPSEPALPLPEPSRDLGDLLEAWWLLIMKPNHAVPELAQFPASWIEATGPASPWPMVRVEAFFERVGVPLFRQIRDTHPEMFTPNPGD